MKNFFKKNEIFQDGIRFVIFGCINTGLTIIIYQILLRYFHHSAAYTLSWLAGIIFLMVVYPSKVFLTTNSSMKKRILLAAVYLLVYLMSLLFLNLCIHLGIHKRLAVFIVLPFSLFLNFIFSRYIFKGYRFNLKSKAFIS